MASPAPQATDTVTTASVSQHSMNQDAVAPDRVSPGLVGATGVQRLPTLYGCAIGRALATVRARSGMPVWTLAVLLDRSPADVLEMEDGRATVSVAVLEVWCDRLGIRASSVLAWAARVAAPGVRGWVIDLRAAAELPARPPRLPKLGVWARQLLGEDPRRPFLAVPEIGDPLAGRAVADPSG